MKEPLELPSVQRVRQFFDYDPLTGRVTRRTSAGGMVIGSLVGTLHHSGYLICRIDGPMYTLHRLVWLHFHGEPPMGQLDHINGRKADNRICNLRPATPFENMWNRGLQRNNTAGVKGVHKRWGKYHAVIAAGRRKIRLGSFETAEEAGDAYAAAAARLHGGFARVA